MRRSVSSTGGRALRTRPRNLQRNSPGAAWWRETRRRSRDAPPRGDPNVLDPSGATAIDWYVPSPDGSRVAVAVLPPQWGEYILRLEQYGILVVLALAFTGVIGILMGPPMNFLARLILGF